MTDFYRNLASDYHWLFSDDIVGASPRLGATSPGNQALLEDIISTLTAGASILDCACGIGADAIALRNRGFKVTASDASFSMVAEARSRLAQYAPEVNVIHSRWEELPESVGGPFDLALCLGNSIVHAGTRSKMVHALKQIRKVLHAKSELIVDSRNWELLYRSKPRVVTAQRAVERNGLKCASMYIWSIPKRRNSSCRAEIVFLFEKDTRELSHRRYSLEFHPFTHDGLQEVITTAGFRIAKDSFDSESPFYAIAAIPT